MHQAAKTPTRADRVPLGRQIGEGARRNLQRAPPPGHASPCEGAGDPNRLRRGRAVAHSATTRRRATATHLGTAWSGVPDQLPELACERGGKLKARSPDFGGAMRRASSARQRRRYNEILSTPGALWNPRPNAHTASPRRETRNAPSFNPEKSPVTTRADQATSGEQATVASPRHPVGRGLDGGRNGPQSLTVPVLCLSRRADLQTARMSCWRPSSTQGAGRNRWNAEFYLKQNSGACMISRFEGVRNFRFRRRRGVRTSRGVSGIPDMSTSGPRRLGRPSSARQADAANAHETDGDATSWPRASIFERIFRNESYSPNLGLGFLWRAAFGADCTRPELSVGGGCKVTTH